MDEKKVNFFSRLKTAKHRNFEITMFAISILMGIAVLASVVVLGMYWSKGASNKVTEENDDAVSSGAVTVADDEPADPTATPGSSVITDDDDGNQSYDEDLKPGKKAYTTAYVNMRSDASLTASVVTKVPSGSKVKLIKLEKEEWFEVDYNGVTGYINAMYLSANKPAPIATATPAPTDPPRKATPKPTKPPKTTKTPKPTKSPKPPKRTKTPDPDVTDEPTEQPTQKPTPEPTKVPTPVPTQKPTPEPTEPAEQPTADPAVE